MRKLLVCTVSLLLSLSLQASDSLYFARIYEQVNENFAEDRYEENIALINDIVGKEAFKELSCHQQGQIFHRIGGSYYFLDNEEEAIRYYRDSVLTRWKKCPSVPQIEKANTTYNIGLSYQYLGEFDLAKKYLDDALAIYENDPDYPPLDLAKKYHAIGTFYLDSYDSFRAELYYENALNLYRNYPDTEIRRFDILNNLLILCVDFKKYDRAKNYFDQALSLYKQYPQSIPGSELSMIYLNYGIVQWEQKEFEQALQQSKNALRLIDPEESPVRYTNALEMSAMVYAEQGERAKAIQALEEVVALRLAYLSSLEDYRDLSSTYENISEVYLEQGAFNKAEEYLNKAFEAILIGGTYDKDNTPVINQSVAIDNLYLVRLLSIKANIYEKKYKEKADRILLEKALALQYKIDTLITQELLSLEFETSKLNFLELILSYYGEAIDDAMALVALTNDQQYLNTAYYFSSKTKAIILQNELRDADALQSIASPQLLVREQALVAKVYDLQEQIAQDETNSELLLGQYLQAQRELETFISEIEQSEPEYFEKKYAFIRPPNIAGLQAQLPPDLAIIEYFYGDRTIHSFWITPHTFFHLSIPKDDQLIQDITSFVDQCHDPRLALSKELGYSLYQRLLREGLDQVSTSTNRLCIIPDGLLHTVPFEALSTVERNKSSYLIQDYSLSLSYSVGLLFRKKDRSGNTEYIGFSTGYSPDLNQKLKARRLLFGESNLAPLSLAREEINRASTIFAGDRFIDSHATLENFYRETGNAKIIHLSLHGLVDFEDPVRSCVLFDDRQEDFVLSAGDLYSHRVNADLVILSACHSASGKIFNGEGVQGMSKAFILSGAGSILSSLWSASEASSLRIMTSFLQKTHEGAPNDLALHQAKLEYLDEAAPSQQHPFYWANFILIGEIPPAPEASFPLGLMIVIALAVVLVGLFTYRRWG